MATDTCLVIVGRVCEYCKCVVINCTCTRTCTSVLASCAIAIQTAGLAFGGTGLCSYRVRGVDGSCAEHLTVESYTVIICQQSYLLLSVFHQPLTLSFQT